MASTKFDNLIALIEPLKNDSVGEWIIDTEHKGTEDDPIQMPYPRYTQVVHNLIKAVYEFERNNPDYKLKQYADLLEERGIEWGTQSMEEAVVFDMDAQGVMALLMGMVRKDRFCEGAILELIECGAVNKWLSRLKEISEK